MIGFNRAAGAWVPFSSEVMLSAAGTAVFLTGAVLMACWPHRPLAEYITANDIPSAFFVTLSASLIIQSYLSLRWGRGEMAGKNDRSPGKEDFPAPEGRIDSIPHGLVTGAVQTVLLVSPAVPLLIIAAALSGMSLTALAQAFAVVVATSLLCRIVGVTCYLAQGKRRVLGYIASRCVMLAVFFGTLWVAPMINPIHILYGLQFGPQRPVALLNYPGYVYAAGVLPVVLLLARIDQRLAGRRANRPGPQDPTCQNAINQEAPR